MRLAVDEDGRGLGRLGGVEDVDEVDRGSGRPLAWAATGWHGRRLWTRLAVDEADRR